MNEYTWFVSHFRTTCYCSSKNWSLFHIDCRLLTSDTFQIIIHYVEFFSACFSLRAGELREEPNTTASIENYRAENCQVIYTTSTSITNFIENFRHNFNSSRNKTLRAEIAQSV
jgi:hypothetical protein